MGSNALSKEILKINNAGIVYTETLAVRQKYILQSCSAGTRQQAGCQADPGVRIVCFPEVLNQSPFPQMQDQCHRRCWTVFSVCPSSLLY